MPLHFRINHNANYVILDSDVFSKIKLLFYTESKQNPSASLRPAGGSQLKDGAKQWNKGCKQGGNPHASDRGTAMAVCLKKRSGKTDLTAVSAEDGGA